MVAALFAFSAWRLRRERHGLTVAALSAFCYLPSGYTGGLAPRIRVLVSFWPVDTATMLSLTWLPGRNLAMMPVSEFGVVTVWPFTAVITSPAMMPALAAAVPHSSPSTS